MKVVALSITSHLCITEYVVSHFVAFHYFWGIRFSRLFSRLHSCFVLYGVVELFPIHRYSVSNHTLVLQELWVLAESGKSLKPVPWVWILLHIPLITMNRLHKTETAVIIVYIWKVLCISEGSVFEIIKDRNRAKFRNSNLTPLTCTINYLELIIWKQITVFYL